MVSPRYTAVNMRLTVLLSIKDVSTLWSVFQTYTDVFMRVLQYTHMTRKSPPLLSPSIEQPALVAMQLAKGVKKDTARCVPRNCFFIVTTI